MRSKTIIVAGLALGALVVGQTPAAAAGQHADQRAAKAPTTASVDAVVAEQHDDLMAMNRIAEIVDASPQVFAGYHMTATGIEVYVAAQQVTVGASLLPRVEAIASGAGVRFSTRSQPRSAAQLQAIEQAVRPDRERPALGRSVMGTQIDPQANTVTVFADGKDVADLRRRAADEFGAAVRVEAVPVRNGAVGVDLGRTNDSAPWYGGDYVSGLSATGQGSTNCSTAFTITNAYGEDFMLSAGHCIAKGWGVTNGNTNMGRVVHRNFPASSNLDNELIGGSSYAAFIWIGPGGASSGQTAIAVNGVANSCTGCAVFLDGAVTGQVKGTLVGVPYCAQFPSGYSCNVQDLNTRRCAGGDSGGPVFAYDNKGGVTAVGIIKGIGRTGGCAYTQLPAVLQYWQARIKTPPFVPA
jgi:hypothetical protein